MAYKGRATLHLLAAAGLLLSIAAVGSEAKTSPGHSDVRNPLNLLLVHRQNQAIRAARKLPPSAPKSALRGPRAIAQTLPDAGHVGVVDDGDGIYVPPVAFDLDGKTLAFDPADAAASQYSHEVIDGGYDADAAAEGQNLTLADDASLAVQIGFAFPFFGEIYEQVYVNSDGNLTFGTGDAATTARDAVRAISATRIAPFFADLDPSRPDAAVRVFTSQGRLTVTWIDVPEWVPQGIGQLQNFQVTLRDDGRIEFAYQDITVNNAIIGIAPGERLTESLAVDFSEPSSEVFSAAVVQIFTPGLLDFAALAQKFYLNHEDAYDFLVIFHNHDLALDLENAFAFYLGVRNTVRGIGPAPTELEALNLFDLGALTGSAQRLQGLMFMSLLDNYPDDPDGRIDRQFGLGVSTPLTVLAHEAGHRFLARPLFVDAETEQLSGALLGRQGAHWSYFFNSEASLLEGNRIVDHGAGAGESRFETVDVIQDFSPLDRYLMGLLPADQVPPSFVVLNPSIQDDLFTPAHEPLAGVFFNGDRQDVTIDMILDAHGRRVPDHTVSQKNFRFAFLLLTPEGAEVVAADVEKVNRFREAFEPFFTEVTGERVSVETELVKQLGLSTWPASGVLPGRSVSAAVFVAEEAEAAVTVTLSATPGISVPAQVTIPAGESFVEFEISGVSPGTSQLTATAGEGFEVAHSNIQVLGSAGSLTVERVLPLELLFGDPRERLRTGIAGEVLPYTLFFVVGDDNLLPYGNVPLRVTVSGNGSVDPPNPVTDAFGLASLEWTLASEPGANRLSVQVEGSSLPPVVVDAVGTNEPHRHRNVRPFLFGP